MSCADTEHDFVSHKIAASHEEREWFIFQFYRARKYGEVLVTYCRKCGMTGPRFWVGVAAPDEDQDA